MHHLVPGTVGIGNPQADSRDAVDLVIYKYHLFSCKIGHRIQPFWICGVILIYRQPDA